MSDIAVDLDRLAEWSAGQGLTLRKPLSANRIGMGQSNLTYLVTDADGTRVVVRRPPRGTLLQSAHDVGREFRIMSALQDTPVPVPTTIGTAQPGEIEDDVPVVVMGFTEGLVLNEPGDTDGVPLDVRHAIGIDMARTLAKVHAVDLQQVGLDDLASHSPYGPRQLKRWTTQLEGSRTRDLPELDRLTQVLQANVPSDDTITLVHGDFHLRNVILDPDTGAVRAAVDWELSTLGDPLADLGSLLAYWPQRGDGPSYLFDAAAEPGFPSRDELTAAYLEASGRDGATVPFWHALGLWKIAVIIEGVRKRAMDNPSNAAKGGPPPAQMVDLLVQRAWRVVDEAGLRA
ncbi:phosphotransferase family protein [Calidifontibacter sp. DB0510]|uniref:Phosphotransferase family protein n=1 Tax=Metallococcus carri TaxID=1656884 RepID=A0A967B1X7_9MICO|nr:phosphotransferase family protein [Metallococcus carri]NHN56798.1 phosphotransferase family protein [Metallococcus carri]NOP37825.1 phosphotransferase family protein [Calidifontibacter sp. DB2511S]